MAGKGRKRCQSLMTVFVAGLLSWSASALTLKEGHPSTYTVVKGDTLWDISAHFLNSPWKWPELWNNNPDIENPHLIYPGDVLYLVWVDGQPRLTSKRLTKLSPTKRVSQYKAPITVLDDQWLLPFMAQDRLLAEPDLQLMPRVIGSADGRQFLTSFDDIYIDAPLNDTLRWGVYRPQPQVVRHQVKGKPSMVPLKHVAIVTVASQDAERSVVKVQSAGQEIYQNDLLLAMPDSFGAAKQFTEQMTFSPSPAPMALAGRIVADLEGFRYQSHEQVVIIDRGSNDGAHPGHMLVVNEQGAKVKRSSEGYAYELPSKFITRGKPLPKYQVGEVMVIRTYPHFSLAVVTQARQPLTVGSALSSPLVETVTTSQGG